MSKIFIFGIDGMDKGILIKYKEDLPNFSKILDTSSNTTYRSVHPPDSHTAWASIYTGLNPAQHGIVDFVDPLEKSRILSAGNIDNSAIRGKTFWDILGKQGKKVCIVFPHLGYPAWEVNGIMVGRSSINDDISTYPESLELENEFSEISVLKGIPKKKELDSYILQAKELIHKECEFTLKLMSKNEWDVAYTYSSTLDFIEHYFWDYFESKNDNKYSGVIIDFYKEYDCILGKYMEHLDLQNTKIMILSDHGHGMRPKKVVNMNEILRQESLLVSRIKKDNLTDPLYSFEKAKKSTVKFIVKHNLAKPAQKMLSIFPKSREIYTSPISVNWKDTVAYLSDLSSIKAYSYGGIKINRGNLMDMDYEEVRNKLIVKFSSLKNPENGEKLFKWVKKREELYEGQFINKYPDLIFDLSDGYGAGWGLHEGLITDAPASSLVPGSHKIDTAVFLCSDSNSKNLSNNMILMDTAPLIINSLKDENV